MLIKLRNQKQIFKFCNLEKVLRLGHSLKTLFNKTLVLVILFSFFFFIVEVECLQDLTMRDAKLII